MSHGSSCPRRFVLCARKASRRTRSLVDIEAIYLSLDGFRRVGSAGKAVSVPVLDVVGVLPDGRKQLGALAAIGDDLHRIVCAESADTWERSAR